MAHFGQTLRELVKGKHFTLKAFAAAAGLSESAVTKTVRCSQFEGSPTSYRAMATALGLTPEQLDAAWMEEAADTATPAEASTLEKTTMVSPVTPEQIKALDLEGLQLVQAMIERRMEQLAQTNGRSSRRARTASGH